MKSYTQSRTCAECRKDESRELLQCDAAFEATRHWNAPCIHCSSTKFTSSGCPLPDMNRELFELWIHDPDLTVLSQDEDLIIGIGENLELLEEFLQRSDVVPGKREILLSAICVVLYDNTPDADDPNDSSNSEFASKATEVLKRNISVFDELNEDYICDYIRDVVYPIIGRSNKKMA